MAAFQDINQLQVFVLAFCRSLTQSVVFFTPSEEGGDFPLKLEVPPFPKQ